MILNKEDQLKDVLENDEVTSYILIANTPKQQIFAANGSFNKQEILQGVVEHINKLLLDGSNTAIPANIIGGMMLDILVHKLACPVKTSC